MNSSSLDLEIIRIEIILLPGSIHCHLYIYIYCSSECYALFYFYLHLFIYFFSSSCSFNQFLTGRKVQFDRCAAFRRKEGAEAGRGLRARTLDSETRGERKIRRRERKRVARVCRFNATLLLRRVIIDARRRRSSFFFFFFFFFFSSFASSSSFSSSSSSFSSEIQITLAPFRLITV